MLTLQYLREQGEEAKVRLSKRNPKHAETVDKVLAIDEENRKAKSEMEKNQSEANAIAKKIGGLMKSGNKAEAEELKLQTAKLKETGNLHWATINTTATNETGFTALPGGGNDLRAAITTRPSPCCSGRRPHCSWRRSSPAHLRRSFPTYDRVR